MLIGIPTIRVLEVPFRLPEALGIIMLTARSSSTRSAAAAAEEEEEWLLYQP